MTTGQAPGLDEPWPSATEACPCGHGDLTAELGLQRPLVQRAIQGDPAAFGALYDEHVDDVYRYLLAWTWDSALARSLTEQVFQGAVTWLPAIAEGQGDLGAWLIALARDGVGQHRGAGWAGQSGAEGPPRDAFEAIEQLDDAQREVVVLRLLLGHSATHTAHLAGYDPRVVQELQLSACAAIWQLLSGVPLEPPPSGREDLRPRWFEHYLSGADVEAEDDPGLSDVLAVADALRQGAPEQVPLPDDSYVAQLRGRLLQSIEGAPEQAPPRRAVRLGGLLTTTRLRIARHPWVATIVAASAIGLVIGVQMAGRPAPRSTCARQPCVATTSDAASSEGGTAPSLPAAGGSGEPTVTTAVPAGLTSTTSRSSTTRGSSGAPTTAPPTTVPRTTRTTRAPTTTRRATTTTRRSTSTTAPTTTGGTTTITTAPGP